MTKNTGGRPSKDMIVSRREKTRELFLKGKNPNAISKELNVAYVTTLNDIKYLQARYSSLIVKNSQLAKKQYQRVEQLIDEVGLLKTEYWNLYQEITDKVKENKQKLVDWKKEVKKVKVELDIAETEHKKDDKNKEKRIKARELRERYIAIYDEPKYPTYITSRIDSLKAILDRVDKESKLLSLFNPQSLMDKNYVSVEVLQSIMKIFKTIITDLIPEDKRGYAFKRLRTINLDSLDTEEVIDAEYKDRT